MKLSIIMAMATEPKLLILDEPTSGLDPVARGEILDIFNDFVKDDQHSILFSSHITSDIEEIADYVIYIHKGEILFHLPKDDLKETYGIVKMTKEQFEHFDQSLCLGYHQYRYGIEALVSDFMAIKEAYPELVFEKASLDDIMRYYNKGGK